VEWITFHTLPVESISKSQPLPPLMQAGSFVCYLFFGSVARNSPKRIPLKIPLLQKERPLTRFISPPPPLVVDGFFGIKYHLPFPPRKSFTSHYIFPCDPSSLDSLKSSVLHRSLSPRLCKLFSGSTSPASVPVPERGSCTSRRNALMSGHFSVFAEAEDASPIGAPIFFSLVGLPVFFPPVVFPLWLSPPRGLPFFSFLWLRFR